MGALSSACSSRRAHRQAHEVAAPTRPRVALGDLPYTVVDQVVGAADGDRRALLLVNRTFLDVVQRALLAHVAPSTRQAAETLIELLAQRPDLRPLVRSFTWRGGGEAPDVQQAARIITLASQLRVLDISQPARLSHGAFDVLQAAIAEAPSIVGFKLAVGHLAGPQGNALSTLCLDSSLAARLETLDVLMYRGSFAEDIRFAELAVERLPMLPKLVALDDRGDCSALTMALIARAPALLWMGFRLDSGAQFGPGFLPGHQLKHLRLTDPLRRAASRRREVPALIASLRRLESLELYRIPVDADIAAALPKTLVVLRNAFDPSEGVLDPARPYHCAIMAVCSGSHLPALRQVRTMQSLQSVELSAACRDRGIKIEYVPTNAVGGRRLKLR